jgi:hypothetical protein
MLSLDSPRWNELSRAYGNAADTPALLRALETLPSVEGEPWETLWSSLAHQGDVYSATFAAVPHIVRALSSDPTRATFTYFQFPAWVEVCRHKHGTPIPADLEQAYFLALQELPRLVAEAAAAAWDNDLVLPCALAAIAASKGEPAIAEAALELTSDMASSFMEWVVQQ